MNEGDNFGTGSNDSGQPSAVMSGPSDGAPNSSKFFGSHSRRSINSGTKASRNDFLAAQSIASNPNNPEFFRAAAAENSVAFATPRKSKKLLIIGLFALVAVAVIAIVAVILLKDSGNTPNDEPTVSMAELKKSFNSYANYLLAGEVTDKDFDINEYAEDYFYYMPYIVYAERVIAGKQDGVDKNQYINTLEQYYESFVESYKNSKFKSAPDDDLKDYFYGYALMPEINEDKILKSYLEDKTITADALFKKTFWYKTSNKDLKIYLENQKNLLNAYLLVIKSADKYGCINNNVFNSDCATEHINEISDDNSSVEIKINMATANDAIMSLRKTAIIELLTLYDSIYETKNDSEVKE